MKHFFLVILLGLFVQSAFSQYQLGNDIDGEAADDRSGYGVSMSADGSRIAIGARDNDGNGTDAGHVRVYDFINGTWVQVGNDIDGEATDDRSGWAVSLSADGSRIAIGARYNDGSGNNAGHVRVYDFINGIWTQIGSDIDGEAADDLSGRSISLSADGSRVAIGAYLAKDSNGIDVGHVRVFEYFNNTWVQIGNDIDGEARFDRFGWSVAISDDGSRVAIGDINNNAKGQYEGHVRVYDDSNGTWTQVGNDIDGEGRFDDSGWSVAMSADGSRLAIGAPGNTNGNGNYAGHVRVYDFINGTWMQLGNDIDGEAAEDNSGFSVSMSGDGNRVAISAPYNDANGNNAGHVRIYYFNNGAWMQVGDDIYGEAADDYSGISISMSTDGNSVAIGASGNDGFANNAGHVRVYRICVPTVVDTLSPLVCSSFTAPSGKVLTQTGQYLDTIPNALGCDSIIAINLTVKDYQPEICLVTADSLTGTYNQIIWEKPVDKSFIDSFIIAREVSLNTYQIIGRVHVDSLSIFNDALANPNTTSYNYKIAIKDTCGAIRSYGSYHKTIHLQYFGAGTLQWSSYEIEGASNPVASYNFYRDDNGTGNFQLLTSLPGSNTSYTDLDYVMNPNAAYRIEMIYANGLVCNPSQFMQQSAESFSSTSYSKSYSNILSLGATSVEEQGLAVHVYPNPTLGFVNVALPAPKGEISVYDIQGKLIKQEQVTAQQMRVDLRSFENGVYLIRIDQDGMTISRTVMLNR